MAVSSKYTQDLSVQIVFFTFSCKWFLCFNFWAVIWSYIVDLFAALHELASASARTLLKLASSVRALLKPYGDTLSSVTGQETLQTLGRAPETSTVEPATLTSPTNPVRECSPTSVLSSEVFEEDVSDIAQVHCESEL